MRSVQSTEFPKFKVFDVKFSGVAESLSISCCLLKLCFSRFFAASVACTSLSFESLLLVRKLGSAGLKLFLFRRKLLSVSFSRCILFIPGRRFPHWQSRETSGESSVAVINCRLCRKILTSTVGAQNFLMTCL